MERTLKTLKKLQSFAKKGLGKTERDIYQKFKYENGEVHYTNGHFLIKFKDFMTIDDGVYFIEPLLKQQNDNYPDFNTVINRKWTHRVKSKFYYRLDDLLYSLAKEGIYINKDYFNLIEYILDNFKPDEILINKDDVTEPILFKFEKGIFMIMPFKIDELEIEQI